MRKPSEPELSNALDQAYEHLVERATQAIAIVQGTPLRVILANQAIADLVGLDRETLQRCSQEQVVALLHPDDRAHALERHQARMNGELVEDPTELRLLRADGEVRWIHARAVPIEYRGAAALHVSCHDVTELKRAERAVGEQQTQQRHLDTVVRRAQMMESLGMLAGGVAHDFNNFLMGFVTNLGLLRREIVTGAVPDSRIDDMETAVLRAAELCQQLLTYSGRGRTDTVKIDLNEVVREMAKLMKASIPPSITLKLELAEQLPAVDADPTQVRQIVMNLLHNAAEAMSGCPGVVTIRTDSLTCDSELRATCFPGDCRAGTICAFVEVSDTGCGMDTDTVNRAFEPFFTTKETGRGLGLAAVLGIARSHGGGLHVESRVGEGSTIRALLPGVEGPPERTPPPLAKHDTWRADDRAVLIVDDDALTLDGLSLLLEHFGFQVIRAAGGRRAVQLYTEHHELLSAVVLDYLMPDMDGHQTLLAMREIDPDVPVILSSGYAGDDARSRFEALEVAGYLRKPYEVTTLVEQLRRIVKPEVGKP